jgi:excisionase family DNA binding protein
MSSLTYSPAEIAQRYHVDHSKVLAWIDRGELRAVNVANAGTRLPRWRITAESLDEFERNRSSVQQPKPTAQKSRRRKAVAAIERRYY